MSRFAVTPILGAGLLAPSLFFLLVMFLKFVMRIDFPYDSLEKWFGPNPNSPRSIVAQALVLLSPIAAFLVSTAPTTRLRISIEEGQLVGSVSIRGNFLRVSTMALSLAIVAVLALYILTENVAEAAIRRYFGG